MSNIRCNHIKHRPFPKFVNLLTAEKCIGREGHIRHFVPDELDMIQMFPKGWTDTGMTDGQRAFCMGSALVMEIPHRIGKEIANRLASES